MSSDRSWPRVATLLLHALAFAVLLGALLGVRACSDRAGARVLVLVDRSASADSAAVDAALARVRQDCTARQLACEPRNFAGSLASPGQGAVDPSRTNLAAALDGALPERRLVVISDGFATTGDTDLALRSLRAAGIEVLWLPVAARAGRTRLEDWNAPGVARTGETLPVEVQVGAPRAGLRVRARLLAPGSSNAAEVDVDAGGRARLLLPIEAAGPLALELQLIEGDSGQVLDAVSPAALVEPATDGLRVLHAGDAGSALADSLRRGGWPLDSVRASELDSLSLRLDAYEALILEDVPVAAASAGFWSTLGAHVRAGEAGLLVTGLRGAWQAGGYRGSTLESLLPLESVPAALDEAATFVFVLDKSGSMGERISGVDRFALARSAVIESLRRLQPRDAAAVLAFDVEARPIVPLLESAAALEAAERPWPVAPRGGTSLRVGLEAALEQFERSERSGRRVLVLVTDGFVGEASLGNLPERLAAARVEVVALAIGPEADVAALTTLTRAAAGGVLVVGEVAELPVLMRAGIDRLRMPVETGAAVAPVRTSFGPFAAGSRVPPLAAHAVLSALGGATIAVESVRGDPLLAFGSQGLGRVAALATDFQTGAPQWLAWARWPELAATLLESVRPRQHSPGLKLRARAHGTRLELQLEHAAGGDWAPAMPATLLAVRPDGRTQELPMRAVAPGRYRVELDASLPGLHRYTASSGAERASLTLARPAPRELEAEGVSADLARWTAQGWVSPYTPAALRSFAEEASPGASGANDLVRATLGALLMFALGVLLERRRELGEQWQWLNGRGAALAAAAQRAWASANRRL